MYRKSTHATSCSGDMSASSFHSGFPSTFAYRSHTALARSCRMVRFEGRVGGGVVRVAIHGVRTVERPRGRETDVPCHRPNNPCARPGLGLYAKDPMFVNPTGFPQP